MTVASSSLEISSTYQPAEVEAKWAPLWEEKGYFRAPENPSGPTFSMALPPPNITGSLHMGHATNATIQDSLIRYYRMKGHAVLWQPGTDHAGIATQNVVEKMLMKTEGKTRHDLGREAFVKRVWEWKEQYGNTIITQYRRMGASLDYSRARFTMDEGYCRAVRKVFVEWFNRGLIYRGYRSVNWCPRCLTTLSDLEVVHEEAQSELFYIRYPEPNGGDGVVVATVRPETMMGDVAVAVHPDDARYRHLIGKTVKLPIMNREIPVIADEYVEQEFGTGALKITPAHDPNDYEIGLRHGLEPVIVIDSNGTLNDLAGPFKGLSREKGRAAVVERLESEGLLIKREPHGNKVGKCDRCSTVIEPYLSEQWFVRMKELAGPAMQVVEDGQVTFHPDRWKGPYLAWMGNIRDWCISRQLWWGHQIPVWYCECGETIASESTPQVCPKCQGSSLRQDPDVLDTWFSSALWPFATLGWPEKTSWLEKYYPTSVLSTARDIINLWVARMIFSSLDLLKTVPYHHVIIHATILDSKGQRMSKSKGTGIDPLDMIDLYGADACRFWMASAGTSSQDVRFNQDKIESSRNFMTKLWNASRFVLMNLQGWDPQRVVRQNEKSLADRWIESRVNHLAAEVTDKLDKFDFAAATSAIYEHVWNEFCDWYLEMAKPDLQNPERRPVVQSVLATTLDKILRIMHPITPFITEELWGHLKSAGFQAPEPHLIVAKTVAADLPRDAAAEEEVTLIMGTVRALRNLRTEMNISASKVADRAILVSPAAKQALLRSPYIGALAKVAAIDVVSERPSIAQSATAVVEDVEVVLPLEGLIDLDKERDRLKREIAKLTTERDKLDARLNNPGFTGKAPAEVVAKERANRDALSGQIDLLDKRLELLG